MGEITVVNNNTANNNNYINFSLHDD